jgi:hypothetical protein
MTLDLAFRLCKCFPQRKHKEKKRCILIGLGTKLSNYIGCLQLAIFNFLMEEQTSYNSCIGYDLALQPLTCKLEH